MIRWCAFATAIVVAACAPKPEPPSLRIAAASDLSRAFAELGEAFAQKTGIRPVFDFGSSGLLAKQIEEGAPFALFAAASAQYAEQTAASGRCDRSSLRAYARGRLGVLARRGIASPAKLADLADARFRRVAIANPEHAPYGRAAQQALERAGVWDALRDRIVVADSVQGAMQDAQSGAADAALVATSLAVVGVDQGGFVPVDAALYDPLDQILIVCGTGDAADAARRFSALVLAPEGREIMNRYGFAPPSDELHSSRAAP